MSDLYICFCSVHCVLNPYHEVACCRVQTCDCRCHTERP